MNLRHIGTVRGNGNAVANVLRCVLIPLGTSPWHHRMHPKEGSDGPFLPAPGSSPHVEWVRSWSSRDCGESFAARFRPIRPQTAENERINAISRRVGEVASSYRPVASRTTSGHESMLTSWCTCACSVHQVHLHPLDLWPIEAFRPFLRLYLPNSFHRTTIRCTFILDNIRHHPARSYTCGDH